MPDSDYLLRREFDYHVTEAHGGLLKRVTKMELDIYGQTGLIPMLAVNTAQTKRNTVLMWWILSGVIGIFMVMIVNIWGEQNVPSYVEPFLHESSGDLWLPHDEGLHLLYPGASMEGEQAEQVLHPNGSLRSGGEIEPSLRPYLSRKGSPFAVLHSNTSWEPGWRYGDGLANAHGGVYITGATDGSSLWTEGSPPLTTDSE